MREESKTLHFAHAGFKDQGRTNQTDESLPLYTNSADFIQDCQQFAREVQQLRSVTPGSRVAVYRVAASVPFVSHAALRRTGRYF